MTDGWRISGEIDLRQISLYITDKMSTLVQVRQQAIAWAYVDQNLCCHTTSVGHSDIANPNV